jgi:hypothetical protein
VSARIIDIETAEIENHGRASGQLNSMQAVETVSGRVVGSMLGIDLIQTAPIQLEQTQLGPVQPVPTQASINHTVPTLQDFTGAERIGTWAINVLAPGLGSGIIMKDSRGAWTQVGILAGGIACFLIPSTSTTYIGWVGIGLVNPVYNIYRSVTYNKSDGQERAERQERAAQEREEQQERAAQERQKMQENQVMLDRILKAEGTEKKQELLDGILQAEGADKRQEWEDRLKRIARKYTVGMLTIGNGEFGGIEPYLRLKQSENRRIYTGFGGRWGDNSVNSYHLAGFMEWHPRSSGKRDDVNIYFGPGVVLGYYFCEYEYTVDRYLQFVKVQGFGADIGTQGGVELRFGWYLLGFNLRSGYSMRFWDVGYSGGMTLSGGFITGITF